MKNFHQRIILPFYYDPSIYHLTSENKQHNTPMIEAHPKLNSHYINPKMNAILAHYYWHGTKYIHDHAPYEVYTYTYYQYYS
jgi:hypothetical protein